jgi:hypothetical protein
MTRVPSEHHALSHATLRDRLSLAAKRSYADPAGPNARRGWDPSTPASATVIDLGRGLFDSFALALHVLWTYQQAWAEETFLSSARLETSTSKLLAHLGYEPRPGAAAVGLQHFRCKTGTSATLAVGTSVIAAAKSETERPVTYETLAPLQIVPELNELRAFMPRRAGGAGDDGGTGGAGGAGGTGSQDGGGAGESGDPDTVPSELDGEPGGMPPEGGLFGEGSVLDALRERIEIARHGPLEERRVARARQDARKLAGLVKQLDLAGNAACQASLDTLCQKLCEAQKIVASAKPPAGRPVGALSEAQEILSRQLRNLAKRQADAVKALECALAPAPGETPEQHAHRLDCMVKFLDAFVGLLLQEARDQLVLLRGSEALNRLDRAFGAGADAVGPLGTAASGSDQLFLLSVGGVAPPVRPGDWLVIAEDIAAIAADGKETKRRLYREAVRVIHVRQQTPPGERSELTSINFQPPLERAYALDQVVLLGNNTLVSEGKGVVEIGIPSNDRRTVPLSQTPLTWLRDPSAAKGRRAEVSLSVGGQEWRCVPTLLDAGPDDAVFSVESLPGGGARVRVGDGQNGAVLPLDVGIELAYRVGLGSGGNRSALRADAPGTANPAIDVTFNPLPFSGGADPEPAGLARTLGPAGVGAGDRAVSLRDVQALAEVVDGVRRARVFSDPLQRRTLVVVVVGANGAALAPAELDAVRRHLLARVPPAVDVKVESRILVPVSLRALLRIVPGEDPVRVVRAARLRLGIDTGPGAAPGLLSAERLDIGDDLYLSQVYTALDAIKGLRSVVVRALHRSSEGEHRSDRVLTTARELLVWSTALGGQGVELLYEEARDS